MKIEAMSFIDTLVVNVDNEKIDDSAFREFVRNTLEIVIDADYEKPAAESKQPDVKAST